MSALSLFQPIYLWALSFLGVILALHFFKRRVIKKMNISTLRFLPAAAVNKSRVRKLVEILLLIARLLLIIALILIFAGLHDKNSPLVALRAPQSTVYTWIDPTISMEYADGEVSIGQHAVLIADSLTGILPPSSEHYLFDHESGRFVLDDVGNFSDKVSSNGEKRAFFGRFGPVDLDEAVNAFKSAVGSSPNNRPSSHPAVFVVISDFQNDVVNSLDTLSSLLIDDNHTVICVSTAPRKSYNYSVKIRDNSGMKGGVTAVVHARGAALDTSFAELTVGNLRVGQRSVYCGKDDSAVVTFDMPSSKIGSSGAVTLHATDPLPFDNKDYFVISDDPRRGVLIIGSAERNRVIAAAIRASAPTFWDPVVVKEGNELSYDDLNSADLIIVNSFSGRSRILESFIAGAGEGKGIIITLDPDREDDFGRAYLASTGLTKGIGGVNTMEKGAHPVLSDTNSALWRGFPALTSANARVYRHVNAIPGDALVRLGGGRALVSSIDHNRKQSESSQNNILLVSTPLGIAQSNNLCETGFFVPFLDRLGRYALASRGQDEPDRYAGYVTRNPFFGTSSAGTLYDADGKLVANWSNQPYVKIDKPGVYSLLSASGETTPLAVSYHPAESEMTFIRPNLGDGNGIYYFDSEQFLEQIGNLSNNTWAYGLWVILGLLLCAEVFLWKRR